jgi:hypothetical protein
MGKKSLSAGQRGNVRVLGCLEAVDKPVESVEK